MTVVLIAVAVAAEVELQVAVLRFGSCWQSWCCRFESGDGLSDDELVVA